MARCRAGRLQSDLRALPDPTCLSESNQPMNKIAAFTFCLCAGIAGSAHAQMLNKEQLDHIVAVAEDEVILQSELDHAVANVLAQYRNKPQQLPQMEAKTGPPRERRRLRQAESETTNA